MSLYWSIHIVFKTFFSHILKQVISFWHLFAVGDQTKKKNLYVIHPLDNPGIVLMSCLLNGDNYTMWSKAMLKALMQKTCLSLLMEQSQSCHKKCKLWGLEAIRWHGSLLDHECYYPITYKRCHLCRST